MYSTFFGFTADPFKLSPDPAFLFRSPQHQEALANLIYGIQGRKGFVVLTGEVGTGKTTLLECLRDYMGEQGVAFASLVNCRLTPEQFFGMIAYDLNLGCATDSKTEVLLALQRLLLQQAAKDSTTALIIDEAHDLSWEVLEEIRLLGNLENQHGKLLQIILAGQPELDRMLDAPNLRQLKQRVVLRCGLQPFGEADTLGYIGSRLAKAGVKEQAVFPPGVLAAIHARSRGLPRLINVLCDNLLLTAYALGEKSASMEMLDEVTADLRLEWPRGDAPA
jgi:general secretion pathway protein A